MRLFAFLANRSTPTSCLHCYSEQSVRLAWQKHQITSLSPKGRKEPATLSLFIGPNIRWTQHGYCDCLIASCCWMINHSTWTAINNFNLIPWIRQDKICVLIKCFQPSTKHLVAGCVPKCLQTFKVVVAAQGGVWVNLCSREPVFWIIPTPCERAMYLTLIQVACRLFAHSFHPPTSSSESSRQSGRQFHLLGIYFLKDTLRRPQKLSQVIDCNFNGL